MAYEIKNKKNISTIGLHAGQEEVDETGSRAVPIYQTTSYVFDSPEQAANRFALAEGGNIYTRLTNPTTEAFEKRMAAIEGGSAAYATASGMSAIFYTIINLTQVGDNIVSADNLYGGTFELFENTLKELGRDVTFVDSQSPELFEEAIDDKTKAIYVESIGNPKLDIPDFEKIAEIAHSHGIPLIADNTVGIGSVRPFDHGADIISSSATKYIGGHGTTLGGIIIEKGDFDWLNGNFPTLSDPDETYNGLVFGELEGAAFTTRIRAVIGRDTGAVPSPFGSFLLLQGLETLGLRIEKHASNALAVAKHLEAHPKVAWVTYSGLESSPNHEVAKKYAEKGYGGIVSFGLKAGYDGAIKFIENVELLSLLANIGDAKSLVIHPASTTHSQLTPEQQKATGVTPDLIRFSVGIEDIEDILADVDQALDKI
ncbi:MULTISPECIES: O-acetylhomoserine aminocarboxypropyltransferase/cysteine synthase family protein [Methanobrevibacter]|uniref:O-acetylhomoserine aminocarboxypropyltransferase/cysteine synthase family protein n=1 Tax=Methanobrevibacter TaxID=2172 RepID=UPI0025DAFAA3|nr:MULTISPECIES: O-acetylhomoserine aminocarboxypropyltransferase/cysteine synthase family protein [Methanobrevibacter]MBS7258091.1 O-acetylhomoserine aminocarboxypropyltransferase/cysteine synthase [Methanobrevibacter sp.]MCI7427717.1 O-acetylhomoserine aminocarboxypropyltransferase/cysteine synthase [Methanobrevibacter sp.]MDD6776809.1 O-acetylhomoserine aminocarboxypropyltransferase/cysteine synthase [Methanobacteriaceae archaeon]MDY3096555.1 O-acetylhomoserine aminocarboxypropyltransferase/